jgi:hypothetical protein
MFQSQQWLSEVREFASFTKSEQGYIRCSIEIAQSVCDEKEIFEHWAGENSEKRSRVVAQTRVYRDHIPDIIALMPEGEYLEKNGFWELLTLVSTFDLSRGKLESFSAYRFQYERIVNVRIRRWLPAAFVAAAAMPCIKPRRRKKLLKSISEQAATAPGWSQKDTLFTPKYIEKTEFKV